MGRPVLAHVATTDMTLAWLLANQLRAFSGAGYEVVGVSAPGPLVERLEVDGIRHVPLSSATRAIAPVDDVRAAMELRKLFRRLRPDIVHTHNPKTGVYGRWAARSAGVPVVVNTVHGLFALPSDGWMRRKVVYGVERLAARWSDAELVQNPEDLEDLAGLGVPRTKLQLLGNGVDLERFARDRVSTPAVTELRRELGVAPGEILCGAVGRLVWEKGYREVFTMARAVGHGQPPVRVVVVGPEDPAKRDALSAADIDAARRDGVVFMGQCDDMETIYAAMDICVLASYREGFPRAAMEAAATGVPIVATDVRGCRQVVDPGRTGLLVPKGDARALVGAVTTLAADVDLRREMGRAARRKAELEFDERQVIDLTLETYSRLLERSSASAG